VVNASVFFQWGGLYNGIQISLRCALAFLFSFGLQIQAGLDLGTAELLA